MNFHGELIAIIQFSLRRRIFFFSVDGPFNFQSFCWNKNHKWDV